MRTKPLQPWWSLIPQIKPYAGSMQPTRMTKRGQGKLKLYFPKFNGDDPNGWIYKCEQYFVFNNIEALQHIQLASFHLQRSLSMVGIH